MIFLYVSFALPNSFPSGVCCFASSICCRFLVFRISIKYYLVIAQWLWMWTVRSLLYFSFVLPQLICGLFKVDERLRCYNITLWTSIVYSPSLLFTSLFCTCMQRYAPWNVLVLQVKGIIWLGLSHQTAHLALGWGGRPSGRSCYLGWLTLTPTDVSGSVLQGEQVYGLGIFTL